MKELSPQRFKDAAKELDRRSRVVKEALSIIQGISVKRRAKRKTKKKGK